MKVIHRIWLGPRPMPERYEEYGKRWQLLNPGWVVQEWGEFALLGPDAVERRRESFPEIQDVLDDIIARDAGKHGEECYVQLADVLAYELIYLYGGIVVNVDIEPIRPMEYLFEYYGIPESGAYAPLEDHERIVNAVLGGPRRHPLYRKILDDLPTRYFASPQAEMVLTTGPQLLTDSIRALSNECIVILPTRSFNCVHWSQIAHGEQADGLWKPADGVVGVHHWGHRKTGRSNVVETATQV